MWALLRLLLNISLFKQTPQEIPYSQALMRLLLVVYFIVAYLALLPTTHYFKTFLETLTEMGLVIAFVWGLVYFSKKTNRYTQVLCAFLGVDILITAIALPALAFYKIEELSDAIMLAIFCLKVWYWLACGHIIRHAVSQPLDIGLALAFCYCFTFYQVMGWMFDPAV